MQTAKVMVVDDSAAMRALFCDILDNAKGVEVCGTASNANEAREKMAELRPNVLTLDVEMPGMSGMDFLTEIMAERPMPVIMLSSITQEGTGTAQRALDLGAVHCFPKPLKCAGAEFDAVVAKLGSIVVRAANGVLKPGEDGKVAEAEAAPSEYVPDGRPLVLMCGSDGIEGAKRVLAALPQDCPPTILLIDASADRIESALASLSSCLACRIAPIADGQKLEIGTVYLANDKSRHVVVEPGAQLALRMVARDPVGGFRPSADLLLGSLAKTKTPALAGLLVGSGADGAKGMQLLARTSGKLLLQKPKEFEPSASFDTATALQVPAATLDEGEIADWILENSARS